MGLKKAMFPAAKQGAGPPKIVIFDWDDTICPSSYLDRMKIERVADMPRHFQKLFSEISRLAARALHEASKHGEVILITNSDDGWVKYSCERFLPDLLPVLDRYRIVSARTLYERFYPAQPLCWKAAAFAHEVNELYEAFDFSSDSDNEASTSQLSLQSTDVSDDSDMDDQSTDDDDDDADAVMGDENENHSNCDTKKRGFFERPSSSSSCQDREIVSFGDSFEEKMAVRIVADQLSAMPKSVMFIQLPTPVQILGELQMVINHMGFVCHNKSKLELEISPEQAEHHADQYLRKRRLGSSRHYGKPIQWKPST